MKKYVSVVLALLMLLCCMPLTVFAAEPIALDNAAIKDLGYVLSGNNVYTVNEGETLIIPEGKTLYIDTGVVFNVFGTIDVEGKVVSRGGVLTLKYVDENTFGTAVNPANICGNNAENYRAEIMIKSLPASYNANGHSVTKPKWFCSADGSSYADVSAAYTETAYDRVVTATLNQYFSFKVSILPTEKYDSSLLTFKFRGSDIKSVQGINQFSVLSAGPVTFGGHKVTGKIEWPDEVIESEYSYLKRFSIYLPTGDGYSVYGRSGEASGESETVKLKYGQEFVFRVDIDKEYSESDYAVYCVNTYKWSDDRYAESLEVLATGTNSWTAADGDEQKICVKEFTEGNSGFYIDENGYYHISADMMKTDCTICVVGVIKNETLSFAAKIMQMLKSIIEGITSLLEKLGLSF